MLDPRTTASHGSAPVRVRPESQTADKVYVESLIRRIIEACPTREPTGEQELAAQQMLQDELNTRGVRTHLVPFRFNRSLYAVLAIHFGVSVLGSAMYFVSPWIALVLHLVAGVSYLGESSHWGYLLRRCFPWRRSQNLIGKLPAKGTPRLRIVMLGHADAAHTGIMFNPLMVSGTSNKPYPQPFGFARKHMLFAVVGFFTLAMIDAMTIATGHWLTVMFWGLTVGSLIGFVLNLQVVFRNQIVPGASDNLSGCAALPVLASRFADKKPDDVEMVFVAAGCEESGVGGSAALMHQMRGKWDPANTIVIGLDILSNGKLCYKTVNEVVPYTLPAWLITTLQDVAARHPHIGELGVYDACAGTDDAVPFIVKGYDGVCLACSDPRLGVSQHYHLMSDTPDNINFQQLVESIDYAEDVVDEIIRRRLGDASAAGQRALQPVDSRRIIARLDERPTGALALMQHPLVWALLGLLAGAYCGMLVSLEWAIALNAFRGAMSALMLLFPIVVVLNWLGWNSDEHLGGKLGVLAVVSVVAIAAIGLFLPEALVLVAPSLAKVPLPELVAAGASLGGVVGTALGFAVVRRC